MTVPFSEFAPDRADFNNPATVMKNVYFTSDHWEPFKTISAVTSALASRVYALISGKSANGVSEQYAAIQAKLYRRSSTSWTDVSRGGSTYTLDYVPTWGLVQSGNYIIATNYGDEIQYVQIGSAQAFANISSADVPKARRIGQLSRHLVVGDTTDATDGQVPNRVWWPAINNPLNWPARGTSAAAAVQSDYNDLEQSDGRVTAIAGGEYGIVFQERAINRMSYIGAPLIYQFDRVDRNRGCICPNAVAQVGRRAFFIAHEGFYVTDGTGESVPIGDGRVDKYFLSGVDSNRLEMVSAAIDETHNVIIWTYPTGAAGDYCDKQLLYNYVANKWSYAEQQVELYSQTLSPALTLEEMDAYGTVDAQTVSWDSQAYMGGVRALSGVNTSHVLGSLTGTPGTAVMTTGEIADPSGAVTLVLGVRPIIEAGTPSVRVGSRTLPNGSITYSAAQTPNARTGYCDVRQSGMFHRYEVSVAGDFGKASGVDLKQQADGLA